MHILLNSFDQSIILLQKIINKNVSNPRILAITLSLSICRNLPRVVFRENVTTTGNLYIND